MTTHKLSQARAVGKFANTVRRDITSYALKSGLGQLLLDIVKKDRGELDPKVKAKLNQCKFTLVRRHDKRKGLRESVDIEYPNPRRHQLREAHLLYPLEMLPKKHQTALDTM